MKRVQERRLDFSSLSEIDDGKIDLLLTKHLRRVTQDCMDRPGDKTKRRVLLEFSVQPVIDQETGQCEFTNVQIECKSKVPTYRSQKYQMRVTKGGLLFNQDFPENIDQQPLFQDPEPESDKS